MEIEIGRGKKGRRAYGMDEIAIVPSRRTRDPEDVDLSFSIVPSSRSASICSVIGLTRSLVRGNAKAYLSGWKIRPTTARFCWGCACI